MAGRSGIGGRSRRRSGLGMAAGPPRPVTWRELIAGLTACDEVTPTFAEPVAVGWLCDWEGDECPASDGPSDGS